MKSFRFRLHAILTLREDREQAAQRLYADALRAVDAVQQRIQATQRQLDALAADRQTRLNHGVPADELGSLDRYRRVLDLRLNRLREEHAAARAAADRSWQSLLKARQDREALEKYRNRLERDHDAAAARLEQRLLDDLASRAPTLAAAWRQAPEEALR
jgi:flagellar FliJ protein